MKKNHKYISTLKSLGNKVNLSLALQNGANSIRKNFNIFEIKKKEIDVVLMKGIEDIYNNMGPAEQAECLPALEACPPTSTWTIISHD